MRTAVSKDGTKIAFDEFGQGMPVVIVSGALGKRTPHPSDENFAPLLAKGNFKAVDYDRRGRGDSGDTPPYAPQREIEDIEAVIDAVGGSAYLVGVSSGALLALEAAAKLPDKVKKAAMYEPPFILDNSRPPIPADYVEHLNALTAAGKRSEAVEYFMTDALLIPAEFVAQMKGAPMDETFADSEGATPPEWAEMEAVAHTLAYDGMIARDYMNGTPLPIGRWDTATMPVVVIVGGNSEPFFHNGAKALAKNLPNAKYQVLPGQDHAVAATALVPVLITFFKS